MPRPTAAGGLGAVPRHLLAAALGALFALSLVAVWSLEGRWFVVVIAGIALLSISMVFAGRLSEFLFLFLLFSVPLAGFAKYPFIDDLPDRVRDPALFSGLFGIGIIDFILLGLYGAWAFRILVAREERLPGLDRLEVWVGLMLLACVLSLWGTASPRLGLLALEHLVKYVLLYFYVSRHFRREHIPWFLGAVALAVAVESAIGIAQNRLGMWVGLILDKGAGGELLEFQESVPGIEHLTRATGTTYESHALGIYLAMLIPYLFVTMYTRAWALRVRLLAAVLLVAGVAALIATYSRSGWLSSFIALAVSIAVLLAWRERFIVTSALGLLVAGTLTAPWVFSKLFERFFTAPSELVSARFEQYPAAWSIWRENFLFGNGAGSYMELLGTHNMSFAYDAPVHFVPLYIGAELGLFGVVAFYGLIAAALVYLWRLIRQRREPDCRIALAGFAGLLAYVFDGMSSPLFREPTVYMQFWLTVGFAVALTRQARADRAAPRAVPS